MFKIQDVSGTDLVFGGDIKKLMPKYTEIPEEFKNRNSNNKWIKVVSDWFFNGLKNAKWIPKEEVDTKKALNHIKYILGSWEPKHEHKQASCAFLLNEWFDDVTYDK